MVGEQGQAGPKCPSRLLLITSMGSMGGAFQALQGYRIIHISQRLVLDNSVRPCVPLDGESSRAVCAALV